MNGEQMIPPITNPLGRGWEQPHRRFIEIDKTHAIMSEQTFKGLHIYNLSNPSGIYEGKMWKSHSSLTKKWYLKWYQKAKQNKDHNGCYIYSREILIVE